MKNTVVASALWEQGLDWCEGPRSLTRQGFGTIRANVSTAKRTSYFLVLFSDHLKGSWDPLPQSVDYILRITVFEQWKWRSSFFSFSEIDRGKEGELCGKKQRWIVSTCANRLPLRPALKLGYCVLARPWGREVENVLMRPEWGASSITLIK